MNSGRGLRDRRSVTPVHDGALCLGGAGRASFAEPGAGDAGASYVRACPEHAPIVTKAAVR